MCIRDRYLTTSAISLIRNIPAKRWVNHPGEKGNGIILKMSEYVMSEEVQYLLVKKELSMTEDRYLSEGFIAKMCIRDRYINVSEEKSPYRRTQITLV